MKSTELDKGNDCAKKLICQINSLPVEIIKDEELFLVEAFGYARFPDYDTAAEIGRFLGFKQCEIVYSKCESELDDLVKEFRSAHNNNDKE